MNKTDIDRDLAYAVEIFSSEVQNYLGDNNCTIYLYGSVALDDFRFGWSDIDILCLTERPLHDEVSDRLVNLRQALLKINRIIPITVLLKGLSSMRMSI